MKSQTFNLISDQVKANCIQYVHNLPADGKLKVTIAGIGSKTDRQRALDWLWDHEIFESGIGHADPDVETVHARSKWMFARPILMRDDELFRGIFDYFLRNYGMSKEKGSAYRLEFANDYISTQKMSIGQVSEYMKAKQMYWLMEGVELTNPDVFGYEFKGV
jgi:hypothetical protein